MAQTLILLSVGFGSTKTGLTTVGYQLKNANGTNNGIRITAYEGKEVNFTKHAAGYWYADMVYGATVVIYVPTLGINISTTVPSQTTKDISELL